MERFVLSLQADGLDLATGGGKGLGLRRLLDGGFPVPPGFVVTTAAYRAFLDANDLAPLIAAQHKQTSVERPESFTAASQAIRAAFAAGVFPDEIADAVAAAYRALDGAAVAVRSSATAEDLPQASFAGQQDTFLQIRGEGALREAIVNCWSSLWTARAMAYRVRAKIAPTTVSLAVVVQKMVAADSAGVLFTVNPVTGAADEMVINAAWGLGEALVAGRVNPDTFVIAKATGEIRQQEIADKEVQTEAGRSGVADIEVVGARRRKPALTPAEVGRLAEVGRDIEAYLGAPQDIEWAISGREIAILQARPVTTTAGVPGDDAWPPQAIRTNPFDRWTMADVGERWPEPVTPLTWSIAEPMINENMQASFEGMAPEKIQAVSWARRAYGRVYMNEGALVHLYNRFYGLPASFIGGSLEHPEYLSEAERSWQWGTLLRRAPMMAGLMRNWERNIARFEADFGWIDAWVDDFMERDLATVGDVDLWRASEEVWHPRLMRYMNYHAQVLSISLTNFALMRDFLQRSLGDDAAIYDLIGGLNGVIAAEIAPSLWQLARTARAWKLDDILLMQEPAAALASLRDLPAAAPFMAQLKTFLRRHGHRCMTEAEWLHPRWIEAPEPVVDAVANYLRAGDASDPAEAIATRAATRERLTAKIEAELDPLRRAYFRWALRRLQWLVRLRDNGQNYLVKLILPIRHIYATLGRRWARCDWLDRQQDFFFLTVPDIEAVLAAGTPSQAGLDLGTIVAARRQAYDYWFEQAAPDVLGRDGQPLTAGSDVDESAELSGLAASAGRVEGVARVVLAPEGAGALQPGEILVTRATDPGWTPVFAVIGGLVLEIGGQLSHGAIVAREYGLPAVVGVTNATGRIRDGQRIIVDGNSGRVYLDASGGASGDPASPA